MATTTATTIAVSPFWSQYSSQGIDLLFLRDGSIRGAGSFAEIALTLSRSYPGKLTEALFIPTQSGSPSWLIVERNGIIAVLIGLLLPAVQKVRECVAGTIQSDASVALFSKALVPRGVVSFRMSSTAPLESYKFIVDCSGYFAP